MESLVSGTGMNTQPIPLWIKAIGIIAIVALVSITAASARQGLVRLSNGHVEASGELKDFLLIMKEEEEVSLSRSDRSNLIQH